jgi:hypothetical protein
VAFAKGRYRKEPADGIARHVSFTP